MSDNKCPSKYDDLMPIFGLTQSAGVSLLLSMYCKNYRFNASATAFVERKDGYPQAQAKFYSEGGDKASSEFDSIVEAFTKYVAEKKFTNASDEGAAYAKAIANDKTSDFIKAFMETIGTFAVNTADATYTYTYKTADEIGEALEIPNLFKDLTNSPTKIVLTRVDLKKYLEETELTYKFDRNLFKMILDEAVTESKSISEWWANLGTDSEDVAENVFYRRVGEPNKLYTKVGEVEAEVQPGSDAWKQLMDNRGSSCFDLGFVDEGDVDQGCTDFISNCLGGKGIDECKQYMSNNKYWLTAPEEVAKTDPTIAKQLLEKFGFSKVPTEYKEAGKLEAFESVEKWSSGLVSKVGEKDAKDIIANSKLIGFLKLLVEKINSSPGILNPSYTGPESVDAPIEDGYFGKWGIKAYAGKPKLDAVQAMARLRSTVTAIIGGYQTLFVGPIGIQRGGGALLERLEAFEIGKMNLFKPSSVQLEQFYEALIQQLNAYKKDLDATDKENFKALIKELATAEEKLTKAQIYLAQYVELLATHKDDSGSFINMPNAQKFVEKHDSYFNKAADSGKKVVTTLEALAECIDKEAK